MDEKRLVKISVIGVSICLVALYIISAQGFSFNVKVGEIDRSFMGKTVNITGKITGMFTNKGHIFFDLEDETGKVKVVLWDDTVELLRINNVNVSKISNGETLNVIGEVQLYRGELEVIPIRGNVKIM